jgi:hypothetical protein
MRLAGRIRLFVIERCIEPARAAGTRIVTIRVGDIHDAMGLRMRQPAVAAALGANKFEALAKVRRIAFEGPAQGANCVFTFELLSSGRQGTAPIARPPSAPSQQGPSGNVQPGGPEPSVIRHRPLESFGERVVDRMQGRVQDLIARFEDHLERFQTEEPFTEPSLYFHQKTRCMLDRARLLGDCDAQAVASCIDDDSFLESLYATLTAWGLDRMGPLGPKLVNFKEFAATFRHHREPICELSSHRLDLLRDNEVAMVAGNIWGLIAELKIGKARKKIVSGSKALHHLLPDLVPPIDNAYTLKFFFGKRIISEANEEHAFHLMYPRFREIGVACKGAIDKRLRTPDPGREFRSNPD